MVQPIIQRILLTIPTLFIITLISFFIIQLPPGDFLTAYTAKLAQTGETIDPETVARLRERYGLDKPVIVQYFIWLKGIVLEGDFGQSLEFNMPVSTLIWERLGLTVLITLSTLIFSWLVAILIGVYSASHQYSLFDYAFTFAGFIGRAFPHFILALVLLWLGFAYLQVDLSGLFSPAYRGEEWRLAKIGDMLRHIWLPIIVLGAGGAAGLIRIMRANTLDELSKPYVNTARAKGLSENQIIWKHSVPVALNPFISSIGYVLPELVSGSVITAIVLNLPIAGPLFLRALEAQDIYLAGSFVLMLSTFTVVGTLISDILLVWFDPRIRQV